LITEDSHLPAALRSPLIELVALVDRNRERAESLARKHGVNLEIATELAPVLPQVEAVVVATPNFTHADLCRQALEHGLPVLVEKPFTTTYADACELNELAGRRGTFISVAFMTRHTPVVSLMKNLLKEHFFGRIDSFHFEFGTAGGWAPLSGYNLDRTLSGGGVLVVSGSHIVDRMLYWFGEPAAFRFFDDSYGGVEANCKACLQFPDGVRGTLFFSKTIDLKNRFTLKSERYRVEIPSGEAQQITLWPRRQEGVRMVLTAPTVAPVVDPFQSQLEEFARVLRQGGSPSVDGNEGARSVKLCEQFYQRREPLDEPWMWFREGTPGAP
jgi:predicted dehydrogenase